MEPRKRILDAALRVFAESGPRGATTRRIAEEARVNEVTLFRHFGTKEALLREAVRQELDSAAEAVLPRDPSDPERELRRWCGHRLVQLHRLRALVRTCLVEFKEHPQLVEPIHARAHRTLTELERYLREMRARGWVDEELDVAAASVLLMGAVLLDAVTRDMVPESFPLSPDATADRYVRLFLRGVGFRSPPRPEES